MSDVKKTVNLKETGEFHASIVDEKWYKVFTTLLYMGNVQHEIVYTTEINGIHSDVIILKEYASKEEMINDLSK